MAAFVDAIKTFLTGDPLQGISKIIEDIHPTPEQRAQAQVLLEQVKLQSDQLATARDQALEQYEATVQNDPTWKKAHGFFVYIVDAALLFNLLLLPLWNRITHQAVAYIPLPDDVMHLFEITFVGFAGVIHGPDIISALKGKQ